jgi:RimJ/RimL family protein N-acetyltransferase
MPEACAALIEYGFLKLGFNKICGGYYHGNLKSKRVQEKLGFKYHHTTEGLELPLLNEIRIGHVNLLTKEDWLKNK